MIEIEEFKLLIFFIAYIIIIIILLLFMRIDLTKRDIISQ